MNVAICKLRDNAKIPTRGSEWAAGYDLYACITINGNDSEQSIAIMPGETKMVGTGISMSIPNDYFGAIFARSGLAAKHGLRPANCVGVVDSDYTGEIMVALHNDSNEPYYVSDGERISQLVIIPYLSVNFREVKNLNRTDRGDGGFGSTGKK